MQKPMERDPLDQAVQFLKGVGPQRAKVLARLGITTVRDVVMRVPRAYRDYSNFKRIPALTPGAVETIKGRVIGVYEQRPRPGLLIVRVMIADGFGTAAAVWFNQPWMAKNLPVGAMVIVSGVPERRAGVFQFQNPEYELDDESGDPLHAGRIVPVYALTSGLNPRDMRRVARAAVDLGAPLMPDLLPPALRRGHGLLPAAEAWRQIHFPDGELEKNAARRSLAFEELFVLQTGICVYKVAGTEEAMGISHSPDGELSRRLLGTLPFRLTAAQERVIAEVRRDMESTRPMSRLVQGDVGSGKTVVAAAALVKAVDSGYQGALMAPTEILAEQHYLNLRRVLAPLGVEVVLLTGSLGKRERDAALNLLRLGAAHVAVGTHALIQEGVEFARLSLVITDEQHRFGVRQRALLSAKAERPDVLVMTATPIPRTLALTLFGDLDVSVIDQLPPGRQPIQTHWKPAAERQRFYEFLLKQVAEGRQGYVICPLVAESEKLEAQAATEWKERLEKRYPGVRFGLLHGRLSPDEKDQTMNAFRAGNHQVLVATTVVEVGVDVSNAAVIIIEGAERFGLAQLHQLRGRVGRGDRPSYCLLVVDKLSDDARDRVQAMVKYSSGFDIAEQDLNQRGPGEIFGTRQHGLPDLRIAHPVQDLGLLEAARAAALALVRADPHLRRPDHAALRQEVSRRFGESLQVILVG